MSCTYLFRTTRPAPLWHRAFCVECRKSRRADALIAFALTCRKAEPVPMSALAETLGALNLPHSMPHPRRDRLVRIGRKLKRPAAFSLAGAALAGYGWTSYIEIDTNVAIPVHRVTEPNAYRDYQRASSLLKENRALDDMLKRVRKTQAEEGGIVDPTDQAHVYTITEKEEYLRQNARVLESIRQGLGKPYQTLAVRSFKWGVPNWTSHRSLARIMRLDSEVAAERKQWSRAVKSGLDAIEIGFQIEQSSPIAGRLAGIECEVHGRDALWPLVDHLSTDEARFAALRFENLFVGRSRFYAALEEEKWLTLSGIQEMMREPGWRLHFAGNVGSNESNWGGYIMLLPYSRQRIVSEATDYLNAQISNARGPYIPYSPNIEHQTAKEPIWHMIVPAFDQTRFRDSVSESENALLLTTLALRAYRLEHGHNPAELNALIPRYLREVPRDPFLRKGALTYRLIKTGYLLYSVGPDCIDDSGHSISNYTNPITNQRTSTYDYIRQDSHGDIVAGVNKN